VVCDFAGLDVSVRRAGGDPDEQGAP
jgi:hypothetical protein